MNTVALHCAKCGRELELTMTDQDEPAIVALARLVVCQACAGQRPKETAPSPIHSDRREVRTPYRDD